MKKVDKVLVLAPHTDDGEIGCGGTISRLIEEGKEVYYVAFSIARASVPKGFSEDILETEVQKATKKLGIKRENLYIKDYSVRYFKRDRQEILEDIINIKKEINPDLVFLPSSYDIHQDHQVISEEGLRAFKRKIVLGYEEPWNDITFKSNNLFNLEKRYIQNKINALKCYKSQAQRNYVNEEFVWSLAKMRGAQINKSYAEAFEVLRWIVE